MGRHCVSITLLLPGQSETQCSGIPSSSWVPTSGLCASEVMTEAREDGAWVRASDVLNGFPEDMAQLWTMHCSTDREELKRSGVCSAEL